MQQVAKIPSHFARRSGNELQAGKQIVRSPPSSSPRAAVLLLPNTSSPVRYEQEETSTITSTCLAPYPNLAWKGHDTKTKHARNPKTHTAIQESSAQLSWDCGRLPQWQHLPDHHILLKVAQ